MEQEIYLLGIQRKEVSTPRTYQELEKNGYNLLFLTEFWYISGCLQVSSVIKNIFVKKVKNKLEQEIYLLGIQRKEVSTPRTYQELEKNGYNLLFFTEFWYISGCLQVSSVIKNIFVKKVKNKLEQEIYLLGIQRKEVSTPRTYQELAKNGYNLLFFTEFWYISGCLQVSSLIKNIFVKKAKNKLEQEIYFWGILREDVSKPEKYQYFAQVGYNLFNLECFWYILGFLQLLSEIKGTFAKKKFKKLEQEIYLWGIHREEVSTPENISMA